MKEKSVAQVLPKCSYEVKEKVLPEKFIQVFEKYTEVKVLPTEVKFHETFIWAVTNWKQQPGRNNLTVPNTFFLL